MDRIETQSKKLQDIETALADPALYESGNKAKLDTLLKEQGALRQAIGQLEAEWSQAEEEIEAKAGATS